MADPFIGEIRAFGFNFPPRGWLLCDGTLVDIRRYTPLFAVIGVNYGGNGTTNFQLPDFMGRAPMHWGNGVGLTPRVIGEAVGEGSVTLLDQEIPAHSHMMFGAGPTAPAPTQISAAPSATAFLTNSGPAPAYNNTAPPNTSLSPRAIGPQGGSQPHNNLQPLLAVNFCIAWEGIFPVRN